MKKIKISIILFLGIVFVFFNQCFFIGKLPRKYFIDKQKRQNYSYKEDFFNSRFLFYFLITVTFFLFLSFVLRAVSNKKEQILDNSGRKEKFKRKYLECRKIIDDKIFNYMHRDKRLTKKYSTIGIKKNTTNKDKVDEELESFSQKSEVLFEKVDTFVEKFSANEKDGKKIKSFCFNHFFPEYSKKQGFPCYYEVFKQQRRYDYSFIEERRYDMGRKLSIFNSIEKGLEEKILFFIENLNKAGDDRYIDLEKFLLELRFDKKIKIVSFLDCARKYPFEFKDLKKVVEKARKRGVITEEEKDAYLNFHHPSRRKDFFDEKITKKITELNELLGDEKNKAKSEIAQMIYNRNILKGGYGAVAAIDIAELIISLCSRAIFSLFYSKLEFNENYHEVLESFSKIRFGHESGSNGIEKKDYEEEEYFELELYPCLTSLDAKFSNRYEEKLERVGFFEKCEFYYNTRQYDRVKPVKIKVPKIYYENCLNNFIKKITTKLKRKTT